MVTLLPRSMVIVWRRLCENCKCVYLSLQIKQIKYVVYCMRGAYKIDFTRPLPDDILYKMYIMYTVQVTHSRKF